jgi:site-specific DNA-adenine methylase
MKTPLNYTGNKSRIVEQIKEHIPKKNNVFVDLFCGGGSVGFSVDAKKIFLIDNNKYVIELSKHLVKYSFNSILKRLEIIIEKYNLTYTAKFGYEKYKKKRKIIMVTKYLMKKVFIK